MRFPFRAPSALHGLVAAALWVPALGQAADSISDPLGDFLPTFAGSAAASPDLDVLGATVTYDAGNNLFTFSSVQAGAVGSTATGLYVWGVNRGAGAAGFAANGLGGVLFDAVVLLRPNGTGSVGGNALPAGAVTVSGNTITGTVSGALLPSTGFLPANYTFNLWPRDTAFAGFGAISDFAPNNANFTAVPVPEPATWLLTSLGLAGLLAWRRKADPSGRG
jgi:hypothetical protein